MTKDTQENNNYNKNTEHQKYVLTNPKIFEKLGLLIKDEKSPTSYRVRYFYTRVRLHRTNSKILRQQHTNLQVDHVVVTSISKNRDIINITFSI